MVQLEANQHDTWSLSVNDDESAYHRSKRMAKKKPPKNKMYKSYEANLE